MKQLVCPKCKEKTPEDRQFCQSCLFNIHYRTFNVLNRPPWALNPDSGKVARDAETNLKYTEAVDEEKKKWTNSGNWAKYEKDRKRYVKGQKAEWIKKGARPEDRDAIMHG